MLVILKKLLKYFQLYYQVLNFGMIVSSALMIWKGLMVVTGSESPIVVVLRYDHIIVLVKIFYPNFCNLLYQLKACFLYNTFLIVVAWNQHFREEIYYF